MQRYILGLVTVVVAFSFTDLAVCQTKTPRILNGTPTNRFDSVGIVGSVQDGGFCTGTLIGPRHVLTAAHCAEVIVGQNNGTFEIGGELYRTSRIVMHPDFETRTLLNDIAIFELSEPVVGIESSPIHRGTPQVGQQLTIVGFGGLGTATSGDDGSFGTKTSGLTTIDEVNQTEIIWEFDDPSESNTAGGDSGGPGFLDVAGELQIASIAVSGTEEDAGLGDTSFNTRIDAFATWIDTTIAGTAGPTDGNDSEPADEPTSDDAVDDASDCPANFGFRGLGGFASFGRWGPARRLISLLFWLVGDFDFDQLAADFNNTQSTSDQDSTDQETVSNSRYQGNRNNRVSAADRAGNGRSGNGRASAGRRQDANRSQSRRGSIRNSRHSRR